MSSGFIYRPKKKVLTEAERLAAIVQAQLACLEIEGGTSTVEMQKTATHLQYKVNGGSWVSLIALSELEGSDGDKGDKGDTGASGNTIEQMYNTSYTDHFAEIIKTGDDVTQINVWTNSSKTVKLFTKNITYDTGKVTQVVIIDEINSQTLTTVIGYSGENVVSTTKTMV